MSPGERPLSSAETCLCNWVSQQGRAYQRRRPLENNSFSRRRPAFAAWMVERTAAYQQAYFRERAPFPQWRILLLHAWQSAVHVDLFVHRTLHLGECAQVTYYKRRDLFSCPLQQLISPRSLLAYFISFHQSLSTMTIFRTPKILILAMVAGLASSLPAALLAGRSDEYDGLFAMW